MRSVTSTSGGVCAISVRSAGAEAARPATVKPPSRSSNPASPSSTTGWSSATTTLSRKGETLERSAIAVRERQRGKSDKL